MVIAAEIVPAPGRAREAGLAMQRLGFRVLHVGETSVSVQAEESLWTGVFGVAFESAETPKIQGPFTSSSNVRRADERTVSIPEALRETVQAVAFAEPPQFF